MLLNKHQKQAVEYIGGPVMIIAGPGTGKTKTLIARIAYLLSNSVSSQNILALTFTNKAAFEMKKRLQNDFQLPTITTFHGLGYVLLSTFFKDVSLVVISEEDREKIIEELKKQYKVKKSVKDISLEISRYKNSLEIQKQKPQLFDEYNDKLKEKNLIDFDDLLERTYFSLKKDIFVQNKLRKLYSYILIDEFQDTNEIQYEIVKLLLNPQHNLFVIGDPLQSIYSFRGADKSIFLKMKKDFPLTQEIILHTNYRSDKNILLASHLLFSDSLRLLPFSNDEGDVKIIHTMHEYSEADWIIKTISQIMGGMDLNETGFHSAITAKQAQFSDFAVIYRTHQLARVLEKKFDESIIPYQLVGRSSLYEQNEYDASANKITLLTMHASKGLEFKYVFICGFEEGIIPLNKAKDTNPEEEKRLLYVGMTRAKHTLYLLYAQERLKIKTKISQFYSLLQAPYIVIQKDEAIEKIKQKRKKNAEKRSQMQLFS